MASLACFWDLHQCDEVLLFVCYRIGIRHYHTLSIHSLYLFYILYDWQFS